MCGPKGGRMKYIQAIMKDGTPHRFVGGIPKEWEDQIEYQKELTDDEVLKVPEIKDKKIHMRDYTQEELDAQKVIKDAQKARMQKELAIALKIKIDTGKNLKLDMTKEEKELNKLMEVEDVRVKN